MRPSSQGRNLLCVLLPVLFQFPVQINFLGNSADFCKAYFTTTAVSVPRFALMSRVTLACVAVVGFFISLLSSQ